MRNIIAGPFWGEFGWELMRWQGIFRYIKKLKPHIKIIMVGRPGHDFLYHDYCDIYIPLKPKNDGETDGWRLNGKTPLLPEDIKKEYKDYTIFTPETCMRGLKQEFIKYEPNTEMLDRYDILIHARDTKKVGTEYRNWPHENYANLVEELEKDGEKNIGFIGSRKGAWASTELGDDLRGIDIGDLINFIGYSRLVIGPSSGPLHLASLCGTPHVVWSDNKFWGSCNGTNRQRYETEWNPLRTKVKVLDEDNWQPPVDKVYQTIMEQLNG